MFPLGPSSRKLHHCPSTIWYLPFLMGPQGSQLNQDPETDSSPSPPAHGRATWGKSVLLPEPQCSHCTMGGLFQARSFQTNCTSLWATSLNEGVTTGIYARYSASLVTFSQCTLSGNDPAGTWHAAAGPAGLMALKWLMYSVPFLFTQSAAQSELGPGRPDSEPGSALTRGWPWAAHLPLSKPAVSVCS